MLTVSVIELCVGVPMGPASFNNSQWINLHIKLHENDRLVVTLKFNEIDRELHGV